MPYRALIRVLCDVTDYAGKHGIHEHIFKTRSYPVRIGIFKRRLSQYLLSTRNNKVSSDYFDLHHAAYCTNPKPIAWIAYGLYPTIRGVCEMTVLFQSKVIPDFRLECLSTPYGLAHPEDTASRFHTVFTDPQWSPMPTKDGSITIETIYYYCKSRSLIPINLDTPADQVEHNMKREFCNTNCVEDVLHFFNAFNMTFINIKENSDGRYYLRPDQIMKYMMWRKLCIDLGFSKQRYPRFTRSVIEGEYQMEIYVKKRINGKWVGGFIDVTDKLVIIKT